MAENFKKNISTLGSENAPYYYSKYKNRQKIGIGKTHFYESRGKFPAFF